MQYSKLVFALPAVAATVLPRDDMVYAYTTEVQVQTVVVTQTAGQAEVTAAAAPQQQEQPVQYSQVAGHGHGHFHSSSAAAQQPPAQTTVVAAPSAPAYTPAPSSAAPPASSAAAPSSSAAAAPSSGGSASSGGCPADTSGQHMSPGVNGAPAKSMIDSINYIRRLYNPNMNCLTWSDSLASASDTCAAAQSESHLRMDSSIVSAPGYCSASYYDGKLASSEFERSMIWMLCQSPDDPELQGTCSGKTAEAGCTPSATDACVGHHDAIVDADNKNTFMGCGSSDATTWISCSFSNTENYS